MEVSHDVGRDLLLVRYDWEGQSSGWEVRSAIGLQRRPCRFGGARVFFICPRCLRRTLRLAVLPEGPRCGACGRITWSSRRETQVQRLVRRANKLAWRLGLEHFADAPIRPKRMRQTTYVGILAQLAPLKADIFRRAGERVRACGNSFSAMVALARWGS